MEIISHNEELVIDRSLCDSEEVDDTDADSDYVPSDNSSDLEERSAQQRFSSKSKVEKFLFKIGKKSKEKTLEAEALLEKDLYLSDDETSNHATSFNEESIETGQNVCKSLKRKVTKQSTLKQPGKKRVRQTDEWICNKRKQKSLSGKEYVNKKNKFVAAKIMKPPCSCKKKCYDKISEIERQSIFNRYWTKENSNNIKRHFIRSCIITKQIDRNRKRMEDSGRARSNTLYTVLLLMILP